ncbi:unnamed protein product [Kluyveromyces dobzhanskii CBS 2104]|uniref:WGS project CCBQ000000000 data, contig 00099 n=1 Tax=Kluyveromyces dobzhanskii CBS 2104 TaxID=1427455 RepID=A0A0A8L2B7_9SACH|nr:unnamed protein product [Kluyveromyces dobzhanskii CBS 2104]
MMSSSHPTKPPLPNMGINPNDDPKARVSHTDPSFSQEVRMNSIKQKRALPETMKLVHTSSTSETSFRRHIDQIKARRQKVYDELKQLEKQIRPREFESYAEYYLIKTFKIGKSVSGRVNVDGLRSRDSSGSYRRSKRSSQRISPPSSRNGSRSMSGSSVDGDKSASDSDSGLTEKENDTNYKPSNPSKINRDITTASIIDEEKAGPIRRSSRLTRKEKEKKSSKKKLKNIEEDSRYATDSSSESASSMIQHLYENLINKVQEPVRRSDWLLPPKNRYTPEKNQPVKHEPEQIKINELARNLRIKKILSRFDGGLAGVRTGT